MIDYRSLRACRVAFVVAIFLPTLAGSGLLAWKGGWRQAQRTQIAWADVLQSLLGGTVFVERVESQDASNAVLLNVTLADPTTGVPRAWLPQVTVRRAGTAWELATDLLILNSEQLDATAKACLAVRHVAGAGHVTPAGDWSLTAHRVLLQAGASQQTFQQAVISVARKVAPPSEAKLTVVAFAADQNPAAEPLRLEWVQAHNEAGFSSKGRLTTGAASVPCRVLASLWPSVSSLGTACEFRGEWRWSLLGPEPQITVAGELLDVDLDALISEQFPHRLSGKAHVHIQHAVIQQGRLSEISGTLEAEGGMLSASLLAAAAEHLKLVATGNLIESPPATAIPFERLHASFHLDGSRLTLQGGAAGRPSGVLLSGKGQALLTVPAEHAVPAVALVRMLVPAADYQVPATRQTATLVKLLPVPDGPTHASAWSHHTPTRLAPALEAETSAAPPLRPPGLR